MDQTTFATPSDAALMSKSPGAPQVEHPGAPAAPSGLDDAAHNGNGVSGFDYAMSNGVNGVHQPAAPDPSDPLAAAANFEAADANKAFSSSLPPSAPSQPFSDPMDTAVEPPTSDLRETPGTVSAEMASEIREQKQQQDFAADPDLAGAVANDAQSQPPITPSSPPADPMDTSASHAEQPASSNIDLPHHPALPATGAVAAPPVDSGASPVAQAKTELPTSPHQPLTPSPTRDQAMEDAPPASPAKVSRTREDDDDVMEDAPSSKRIKEDDGSQPPEFKVPQLPRAATGDTASQPTQTAEEPPSTVVELPDEPRFTAPMTDVQHKFVLKGLQALKRQKNAAAFLQPVDYVNLNIPTYPDIVKHPMDLGTIEDKLKNKQYSSVRAFVDDFNLMVRNCVTFNGLAHPVTVGVLNLKESFGRTISNVPSQDEQPPPDKKRKVSLPTAPKPTRRESRSSVGQATSPVATSPPQASQAFALSPSGVPLIRRDSTANDGRPKREIHPPASRDLPYSSAKPKRKKYVAELKFCKDVLDYLKGAKLASRAFPFKLPVDPVALNIPNYFKVVKKPIDMSTITAKLESGQYENSKEFEADIRLMFNNCYKFNPPSDSVYKLGRELEDEFDRKWATKADWLERNAPGSGPQSPGTSPSADDEDEEEEEEDEPEEPDSNMIADLQKQISLMSQKVEALKSKQNASPPAPKKGAKGKGAAPKSSKKAPAKPEKKKVAPKRTKAVTYEEKHEISERINALTENRMAQALGIIRKNQPQLKNVQDDEIELDIDELGNETLLELLTFVRKHAPIPADEAPVRPAPAAPAPSARPKKNKPMSAREQELRIQELRAAQYSLGAGSQPTAEDLQETVEGDEGSSGDESEEESEEE